MEKLKFSGNFTVRRGRVNLPAVDGVKAMKLRLRGKLPPDGEYLGDLWIYAGLLAKYLCPGGYVKAEGTGREAVLCGEVTNGRVAGFETTLDNGPFTAYWLAVEKNTLVLHPVEKGEGGIASEALPVPAVVPLLVEEPVIPPGGEVGLPEAPKETASPSIPEAAGGSDESRPYIPRVLRQFTEAELNEVPMEVEVGDGKPLPAGMPPENLLSAAAETDGTLVTKQNVDGDICVVGEAAPLKKRNGKGVRRGKQRSAAQEVNPTPLSAASADSWFSPADGAQVPAEDNNVEGIDPSDPGC